MAFGLTHIRQMNNKPSQDITIPAMPHPDKVVQHRVSTINQLVEIALLFNPDNKCWVYRGQSNSAWHLSTTLERGSEWGSDFSENLRREQAAISKFRLLTRGRLDFGNDSVSWLSAMQHYGALTRLLDFTRSFFVALFFASQRVRENTSSDDFAVWCLNLKKAFDKSGDVESAVRTKLESDAVMPENMSSGTFNAALEIGVEAAKNFIYFDEDERILVLRALANKMLAGTSECRAGVIPIDLPNSNERILSQNGLFVMPANFEGFELNLSETLGVDRNAFGELMEDVDLDKLKSLMRCRRLVCTKLVIDGQLRADVVKLLNAANIIPRTIYPDIPGVVRFVH